MFSNYLLSNIKLNFKRLNATFFFQIFNTICLIAIVYLMYKLIKWIKRRFSLNQNMENRVEKLENDVEKLKNK